MDIQFCPRCGSQNPGEAIFCNQCGDRLKASQQPLAEQPVEAAATAPQAPHETSSAYPPQPPETYQRQPGYVPVMVMDYPKAGLGSRFLSYLVDSLVTGLPFIPGALLMSSRHTDVLGGVLLFLAFGWGLYYGFCKDGMCGGQSYGKKLNGLMVVDLTTNLPCKKGGSILRALSWCIPYVGGLIEIVMILASDKGRRLGDRFGGTQVIEVSQYRQVENNNNLF